MNEFIEEPTPVTRKLVRLQPPVFRGPRSARQGLCSALSLAAGFYVHTSGGGGYTSGNWPTHSPSYSVIRQCKG
jgi:hypothetical protein